MLRFCAICLCTIGCLTCGCATGTAAPPTIFNKDAGTGHDALTEEPGDSGPLPEGAAGSSPDAPPDTSDDGPIDDQQSPADVEPVPDGPTCNAKAVINEIQTEGVSEADDEFVELYNGGTCPVPMDEYSLYYRSASGTSDTTLWTAIAGQTLAPGAFFVLGGAKYAGGAADFTFAPGASLALAGGGLALRRNSGTIDMVGWGTAKNGYVNGSAAPAPSAGKSIGRHPDGQNSINNATDFKVGTPTPRKTNN